jgi:hypothetical protein
MDNESLSDKNTRLQKKRQTRQESEITLSIIRNSRTLERVEIETRKGLKLLVYPILIVCYFATEAYNLEYGYAKEYGDEKLSYDSIELNDIVKVKNYEDNRDALKAYLDHIHSQLQIRFKDLSLWYCVPFQFQASGLYYTGR